MLKKLCYLIALVLVLSLAGSVSAQVPPGWISEDVGNPAPGDASESGGTWEITGNGHDIWDSSDNFHFVYQYLEGDGEMIALVVDNGTGSNAWAKGGVMIRQDNTGPSPYAYVAVTGSEVSIQYIGTKSINDSSHLASGQSVVQRWHRAASASVAEVYQGTHPWGRCG